MAQTALAKNCGNCGTLVACGGNFTDVEFYGACPCCRQSVAIANPNAPAMNAGATIGGVSVHGSCCKCSDDEKSILPISEVSPEPHVLVSSEPQAIVATEDDLQEHGSFDAIS